MPNAGSPMRPTRHRIESADARSLEAAKPQSVALVVTSPPYPMIEMWDEAFFEMNPAIRDAFDPPNGEIAFALMHTELDKVWDRVCRALVPGGIACINIGDATRSVEGTFRLYSNHARILHAFESRGLQGLPHILWRKQTNAPNKFMGSGMLAPGAYVTLEHEHILVLRKGGPRDLSWEDDRDRRRRSAYFWEERNTWFSDLWDFKGARQSLAPAASRERSGAFPFELAYRLVAMFSIQGDTVLDPFLGTGTTSLACAALGRESVGVEVDGGLAAEARDRLARSAPLLNSWTTERLERHLRFVRERVEAGKLPKHRSAHHGFAVVTRQETDLVIDLIRSIEPSGPQEHTVEYSASGGAQMSLGLEREAP